MIFIKTCTKNDIEQLIKTKFSNSLPSQVKSLIDKEISKGSELFANIIRTHFQYDSLCEDSEDLYSEKIVKSVEIFLDFYKSNINQYNSGSQNYILIQGAWLMVIKELSNEVTRANDDVLLRIITSIELKILS